MPLKKRVVYFDGMRGSRIGNLIIFGPNSSFILTFYYKEYKIVMASSNCEWFAYSIENFPHKPVPMYFPTNADSPKISIKYGY